MKISLLKSIKKTLNTSDNEIIQSTNKTKGNRAGKCMHKIAF